MPGIEMRLILDTTILVKIDRKDQAIIDAMKNLETSNELHLSTITIMEILTGSNLRRNAEQAIKKAKMLMARMNWLSISPEIAEKAAEINAYLIANGQKIELPDVVIAATCDVEKMDAILTMNQEHYNRIPFLKDKIYSPLDLNLKPKAEPEE